MKTKRRFSTEIQLMLVLFLAAVTLMALSMLLGGLSSRPALAQGPIPISTPAPIVPAPLSAFGLTEAPVTGLADASYDLAIANTASFTTSVSSGSAVTYTITITNRGPDPAQNFTIFDTFPSEMKNFNHTVSPGVTALWNSSTTAPQWLVTSVLSASSSMMVTVTGILTSGRDVQVVNTAVVTPFVAGTDPTLTNNTASVTVTVKGYLQLQAIYLPVMSKYPTPTPTPTPPVTLAYHQNFEDKGSSDAWYQGTGYGNGCTTSYTDGRYKVVQTKENKTCFPAAKDKNKPESPYRTYGEWEVLVYDSDGTTNAAYGMFINGNGGDNYYLFRIWPNNGCGSGGGWELKRKKPGVDETTIAGDKNGCYSAIIRGKSSTNANTIRIAHKDLTLSMYANGTLLGSVTETSDNNRTGKSAGVYVRSSGSDVTIKFDDFKVYKYP